MPGFKRRDQAEARAAPDPPVPYHPLGAALEYLPLGRRDTGMLLVLAASPGTHQDAVMSAHRLWEDDEPLGSHVWEVTGGVPHQLLLRSMWFYPSRRVALEDFGGRKASFGEFLDAIGSVERLDLSRMHAVEREMARVGRLQHLRWLNLSGADVSDPHIERLRDQKHLAYLDLCDTHISNDSLGTVGSHMGNVIVELRLNGCPGVSSLVGLRPCAKLQVLTLGATYVDDMALSLLPELPELRVLSLSETYVTDAGLQHIGKVKRLESLNLSQVDVNGVGLSELSELEHLTFLTLSSSLLDDAGARQLAKLRQLRELDVSFTLLSDASLQHLEKLTRLESLVPRGTDITLRGLSLLREKMRLSIPR